MRLQRLEVNVTAGRARTKTVSRIKLQKFVDNVNHFRLKLVRNHQLSIFDLVEDLVVNGSMEGCLSYSHLVNDATKGPKIHTRRRYVLIEHLW